MKLAVTPFNLLSIKELSKLGADIFILGNDDYANRLVSSYSMIELQEAKNLIASLGKELYLNMNLILHNDQLETMKIFLQFAKDLQVDGIIFGDLGTYMLAREMGLESKLIYHPETLNTNYYDTEFWNRKGIKGITIAKEISMKDMIDICKKKKVEVSMIGHGHLNMFHSRRPLIQNFFQYSKKEYDTYLENRNLTIVEEIRNESYPIFQDSHGTHIFREKAMESYKEILELSECIDVFIIDGIFKDTNYLLETVSNYQSILNSGSIDIAESISSQYKNDHDSGFLYKKTQYDKF
jgi:putative protease